MNYVTAIVLAAGRGLRFSRLNHFTYKSRDPASCRKTVGSGTSKISKLLLKINSQPIIIHCLKILNKHPDVRDIIVVVNAKNKAKIISEIGRYRISKIKDIVLGGRLRQDSVCRGLKVMDRRTDLVLIHDGGRPFIDKKTISRVIKEAKKSQAAIAGVPVKATIKQVHSPQSTVHSKFLVKKTLDRDSLWEIQTPQVFKKDLILEAYEKFSEREVTDDASLVEKLGAKVRIVMGSPFNIKITTPEDLIIARAIAFHR